MTFNSIAFLVFAFVFFLFWPFAKKENNSRWFYIIVMSLIFYSWLDWRFIFLLLFTGLVDFYTGQLIHHSIKFKKLWLVISLSVNILSLLVFKYSLFIAQNLDLLLHVFNVDPYFVKNIPSFTLVLPLGISFYTFNSMSYTIDIYRKNLEPVKSPLQFMAFISFFPHLVAGPIIRAKDILFQLNRNKIVSQLEIWHGLQMIVFGLFHKMVLADNLSVFVDRIYQKQIIDDNSLTYWLWAIAFSFQIYFDFSGYSKIAKGLAKLCGIQFRLNFNHPYFSTSLKEFWNRWHISLSHWFRDYLYLSLGGNRKGKLMSNINLWITMLVSGFWHGANFTFIIWGAIHAFFSNVERVTKWPSYLKRYPYLTFFSRTFILLQVLVAWVFFRCQNINEAFFILQKMFTLNTFSMVSFKVYFFDVVIWLFLSFAIEYFAFVKLNNFSVKQISKNKLFNSLAIASAIFMILFFRGPEVGFIYFQF